MFYGSVLFVFVLIVDNFQIYGHCAFNYFDRNVSYAIMQKIYESLEDDEIYL